MKNIKVTKVRPTWNGIVTTAERYTVDATTVGGILIPDKRADAYRDYQRVIEVGPTVRGIEKGDLVHIIFDRFKVRTYKENSLKQDDPSLQHMDRADKYEIPCITLSDTEYFFIHDNDVDYVIPEDGYEEIENPAIQNAPSLVIP